MCKAVSSGRFQYPKYPIETARLWHQFVRKMSTVTSAWPFLNKTNDPQLSMLRKFAAAVGCSVKSLF
jgi:hypothetical protein